MKTIKKIINLLITVILSFTIIFSVFSGFVRFILTNKNMYTKLLNESNTYSLVYDKLYNKIDYLLGDSISDDLKKNIITQDDVKKEADVVLDCIISDIKNGQANVPEIDDTIYKERTADALKTLIGLDSKLNINKELSYEDGINDYRVVSYKGNNSNNISSNNLIENNISKNIKINTLTLNYHKNDDDNVMGRNVTTREELEEKGREILKEKGITESEAKKKLEERGMSESDVLNFLEENGFVEDESKINDNNSENQNTGKVTKKEIQDIASYIISNNSKSLDEKMEEISSKLMEKSDKIIKTEINKLNCSDIINTSYFKLLVEGTSLLYNMFYISLGFIIVLIIALFLINHKDTSIANLKIGGSLLFSGTVLIIIFGSAYYLKYYRIVISYLNKSYFESMILNSANEFLKIMLISSVVIFLVGLIINIIAVKREHNR